jgi:hypothetical protein
MALDLKGGLMKKTFGALGLAVLLATSGCMTYPVAATNIIEPQERVSAEASKFSFLFLSPLPSDTGGKLLHELVEQCGGGSVTGITTGMSLAFLVIGQQETMTVSGYCTDRPGGAR